MATYNVHSCTHQTLSANTVDVVNTDASFASYRITHRGTLGVGTIFVRTDGTDPEANGDDNYRVAPGEEKFIPSGSYAQVRLICTSGIAYSVEGHHA